MCWGPVISEVYTHVLKIPRASRNLIARVSACDEYDSQYIRLSPWSILSQAALGQKFCLQLEIYVIVLSMREETGFGSTGMVCY